MRLIDADKFETTLRSHIISNNHSAIRLNTNQIANNDAILDCIDWLHKEPTVEERQTGEWIDHSEDFGYVECPFCEHLTNCEGNIDELHYCWNCGAKMKKDGEEEGEAENEQYIIT